MSEGSKEGSEVVTATEAAAIKGVTRQAVYIAIREGRLPARKSGATHLIRMDDLEAWHVVRHPKKPRRPKKEE